MFTLLNTIIFIVLFAVMMLDGGAAVFASDIPDFSAGTAGPLFWIALIATGLWGLFSVIPSIAVAVRRLHDRNLTGWIYLGIVILQFIPVVGLLVSIGFLVLMVLPGTAGSNKYGLDPKNPAQTEVFE